MRRDILVDLFAAGIIAICWMILFEDWLMGKRIIPWDAMDQIYPWMKFAVDTLKLGNLPFWNPYLYAGYPAVSDPQAHTFSVLAIALMALPDVLSVHWFDVVIVLHSLLGGLGVYLVARSHRLAPFAAIIGALVFLCGGSAAGRMQHVGMILAYAYFPWAFLFLKRTLDKVRYRDAVLFGLFAGLMAVHENHVAYLCSWILLGYVGYRLAETSARGSFLKTRLVPLLVGGVTALIILLPQLYATLLFLPYTNRPEIPFDTAASLSLRPLAFLTLLLPDAFDSLAMTGYWGPNDVTESYLYIGIIPAALLIQIGLVDRRIGERAWLFFLGIAAFCFVYAVGAYTPIYKFIFENLPGANLYRRPTDATFPLNFALAILAAAMMDRLINRQQRQRDVAFPWLTRVITVLIIIFFAIITMWALIHGYVTSLVTQIGEGGNITTWDLIHGDASSPINSIVRKLLTAGLLFAAGFTVLLLLERWRSVKQRALLGSIILALLVADYHHYSVPSWLNGQVPHNYRLYFEEQNPLVTYLKTHSDLAREQGGPFRVEFVLVWPPWWNAPAAFGIHSTQGLNPLYYNRYDAFVGVKPPFFIPPVSFTEFIPSYGARLFDLLGVKYVVTLKDIRELDPKLNNSELPLVASFDGINVYENLNVLPRAMLLSQAMVTTSDGIAKDWLLSPEFDPQTTVILHSLPANLPKHAISVTDQGISRIRFEPNPGARVRITSYQPNEIRIFVETAYQTFLLLNDPFFPGWEVTVDGERRELLRANYLFRAVYVNGGDHEVIFRFRPFAPETILSLLKRYFP